MYTDSFNRADGPLGAPWVDLGTAGGGSAEIVASDARVRVVTNFDTFQQVRKGVPLPPVAEGAVCSLTQTWPGASAPGVRTFGFALLNGDGTNWEWFFFADCRATSIRVGVESADGEFFDQAIEFHDALPSGGPGAWTFEFGSTLRASVLIGVDQVVVELENPQPSIVPDAFMMRSVGGFMSARDYFVQEVSMPDLTEPFWRACRLPNPLSWEIT